MDQAGGASTTGTQNVLDIQATSLHDRVPIVMGSTQDVAAYEKFCAHPNRESVNAVTHAR
jgi:fructose-1,6-bisphosphatase I